MIRRRFALPALALLGSCGGAANSCAPVPPAPAPVTEVIETSTGETAVVGLNASGRQIVAERYGSGGSVIVVVGHTHGNEESPAVVNDAVRAHGWTDTTVWLVPTLNDTGARLNANGADLNRDGALRQPESQALNHFVNVVDADLVVYVHSPNYGVGHHGGGEAVARQIHYATGLRWMGNVMNHPFLWTGIRRPSVLVETAAVSSTDAPGGNPRTQTSHAQVREQADVIMNVLDGVL